MSQLNQSQPARPDTLDAARPANWGKVNKRTSRVKNTHLGKLGTSTTIAFAFGLSTQVAAQQTVNGTDSDLSVPEARELVEDTRGELGFSWEGEIELGYESVIDSNVPGNETDTAYAIGEFVGSYSFGNGVSVFGGLTFEEVEDGIGDTGYGFYIHELGLEFSFGNTTVAVGKSAPAFGAAWDETAGFFGAALAEDYELTEQIGVFAEIALESAGTLSFGAFFADNTFLSESAGFNRGRNSTANGGAGNTGQLDNFALQWAQEFGDTRLAAGARYLSAGTGDVSDETGAFLALGHSFGDTFNVYAEVAAFDGFGGSADNATYVTLNGVYNVDNWAISGTVARRDIDSAGVTDLVSIGAEYTFSNDMTLGGAIAFVDDAGTEDTILGINLIIPLDG